MKLGAVIIGHVLFTHSEEQQPVVDFLRLLAQRGESMIARPVHRSVSPLVDAGYLEGLARGPLRRAPWIHLTLRAAPGESEGSFVVRTRYSRILDESA